MKDMWVHARDRRSHRVDEELAIAMLDVDAILEEMGLSTESRAEAGARFTADGVGGGVVGADVKVKRRERF